MHSSIVIDIIGYAYRIITNLLQLADVASNVELVADKQALVPNQP